MPFNGSGAFAAPGTSFPAIANTLIESAKFNAIINDIATALTTCVTKDGQTTITAPLPMAGYRHTGVGSATARDNYATAGQIQDGGLDWVAAGGTADALTATYAPALTALVDGQLCFVRAGSANATTTPTFAPNGLTAHTVTKLGGSALVASEWAADQELMLRYKLASTRWELLNPGKFAPSGGAGGDLTGSYPNPTIASGAVTQDKIAASVIFVPTGAIIDYGGTAAPTGFLACDGSAVSRTTYAALFTAIGTTWGAGNGTTTFNVPSLARRTTVGSGGSGTGTLANTVGATGGEETHTLTTAELAAHNHRLGIHTAANGNASASTSATTFGANDSAGSNMFRNDGNGNFTAGIIENTGSGTAHNVIQPSAVVLKIIKI